jgi:hypothetical protein
LPESIFERDGETFVPTEAALSPWSDQGLHGGPPAMLMAREVERFPAEQPMFVVRMTVELLRQVGKTPLAVRSRMVRPGRKVQIVESSLWSGEQEAARMTAVRIRAMDVDLPADDGVPPRPGPDGLPDKPHRWRPGDDAYHLLGVEVRSPMAVELIPAGWAWFRLKLPVVPGEEPSPLQRVCAAADFPNGISYKIDPRRVTFINPELTVYVHRLPAGDWVLVDAHTWLGPNGTGVAEGALYDAHGRIGRSIQGLLLEPRA